MISGWSRVTVVVLVLDAETLLAGAINSVPAGAEILVADGGSTDRTVHLARELCARVVGQDLDAVAAAEGNFDVARNAAAQQATREWVLFLDADERIDPVLAESVACLVPQPEIDAYWIARSNLFWGRPVRLLGDDRQLRLVRRGRARYIGNALHASPQVEGGIAELPGRLVHLNVRNWGDVLHRYRRDIASGRRHTVPPRARERYLRFAGHMFRHYYLQQAAWRDGWRGLLVSLLYAAYHGAAARAEGRRAHG